MLTVEDAIATLLANSRPLTGTKEIALGDALGRTLAADIAAPIDVPPADNSAMDGYALRYQDWRGPEGTLPLSQRIAAGTVPQPLEPGTAARIFTGAMVPEGADTVVIQENCEEADGSVRIQKLPGAGANIRKQGQDIPRGKCVLAAGHRLRPQDLGLVASLGMDRVEVRERLTVAVLATGDELVEPGEQAKPGQIYNSNRYLMKAQCEAWNLNVLDLGVARDEPGDVRSLLKRGAKKADVVITSGGVSVGEEDHVKDAVASMGALDFWRIAIKPGKPFAFGQVNGTPFIGLPGNPVSVFVTLLVIARPFLFASQGITDACLCPLHHVALFSKAGTRREEYLRVRETDRGLELYGNQSSGALFSTSWGNGLVRQKPGKDIVEGDTVDYFPWAQFNR